MQNSNNPKIAVAFDGGDCIASFSNARYIQVYIKVQLEWNVVDKLPIVIDASQGLTGVRSSFAEVINKLDNCKIIVAASIGGVFYAALDTAKFDIYEASEFSEKLLDAVLRDATDQYQISNKDANATVEIYPTETQVTGNYSFDLIKLQQFHPEISSKKALIPFLEKAAFAQLELLCSHIPPWFEQLLPEMSLSYESTKLQPNEYKVVISKKPATNSKFIHTGN